MDTPKSLCLVSYAVNGSGLGHLTRLIAINRWMRRFAALAGVRTQHYFLTTSEADTMLFQEGFAGFKLPSKSIVEDAGIHKPTYLGLAKQWVWHSVGLLRPDILLVDTFPNGSFQELLGVLDLCRHKALVLRPVKDEFARRASFKAMVQLYDRVIVPEADATSTEALGMEDARVRCTGPIMLTERFELLARDVARARMGIPAGKRCVLISAGGGGDPTSDAVMDRVLDRVMRLPDVHAVIAAGPLYRGAPRHGPGLTFWTSPGISTHFLGVDAAVCAAGFNTVHELMFAGVPTLFLPQDKVADDQHQRVAALVDKGAALTAAPGDVPAVDAALSQLLSVEAGARMSSAARQAVPSNHARDAAEEVLSLALPPSLVRHARELATDDRFTTLASLEVSLQDAVDLAVALHGDETALDRGSLDLDAAFSVLESARTVQAPAATLQRLAAALGRKMRAPHTTPSTVGDAICVLLHHPSTSGQWSGLLSLLRLLSSERELRPRDFANVLVALVEDALHAGKDLFGLTQVLTGIQAGAPQEVSNAVLFERGRAALRNAEASL